MQHMRVLETVGNGCECVCVFWYERVHAQLITTHIPLSVVFFVVYVLNWLDQPQRTEASRKPVSAYRFFGWSRFFVVVQLTIATQRTSLYPSRQPSDFLERVRAVVWLLLQL